MNSSQESNRPQNTKAEQPVLTSEEPAMPRGKPSGRRRPLATWGNFVWLLIAVMIILTIVVMVWASHQQPLSSEHLPPNY